MAKDSHIERKREKEISEGFLSGRGPEIHQFLEEYGEIFEKQSIR
jgi:hypothetical protein